MKAVLAWVKQPSTLYALGLLLGAGVYWLTENAATAMAAAAIIPGAFNDNTVSTLRKIEGIEDTIKTIGVK